MKDKTKHQLLIDAIKEERELFKARQQSTLEHDFAIHYLETGEIKVDPYEYELLDSCINDYDAVLSDYLPLTAK